MKMCLQWSKWLGPKFEDEDDQTALHRATIHERKEMVECLIKLGATTKAKDSLNWTPLHYAIKV